MIKKNYKILIKMKKWLITVLLQQFLKGKKILSLMDKKIKQRINNFQINSYIEIKKNVPYTCI